MTIAGKRRPGIERSHFSDGADDFLSVLQPIQPLDQEMQFVRVLHDPAVEKAAQQVTGGFVLGHVLMQEDVASAAPSAGRQARWLWVVRAFA